MAADRSQAIPNGVPRLLTCGLTALAILLGTTTHALAAPHPGGNGVRSGADGYTPWANTPAHGGTGDAGSRSSESADTSKSSNTPCHSDGMGGCLIPKCGDPMGTGMCDPPGATPTPVQLAQQAWSTLRLPVPDVRTAPPRGARGLVGLPEWLWVPRGQWRSMSKRASAGAVWAQVTATPKQLTIEPGAGLAAVSCGGPGAAYDPSRSASVQRTDCSYTYDRSSKSEPGAAYRVRVTVVWGGTWIGSGVASGVLPDISRSTTFQLRVAEGQGLYE